MSVVLGFDESPGALRALRVAIEMSAAFGEPLVLVHAVRVAEEAGVRTTVELIDEKPAQALMDAAARHEARVIVVGTWGESPVRGALLGSTPHKLLHLSDVPVLCVPTET